MSRAAALLGLLLACCGARGAELTLTVGAESLHENMPFVLILAAKGFEETPVPDAPPLAIDGAEVTYLGVRPNVVSNLRVVDGQRTEWRDVTFNYRWQVVAPAPGRYRIAPFAVAQGDVEARHGAAEFEVSAVPGTEEMQVRMILPERAVWVGETFDAEVEWLLARNARSYEFAVPLFDVDGATVSAPPASNSGETGNFQAQGRELKLPLRRSEAERDGRRYTRFVFPAKVTIDSPGTLDLDAVRVVARLAVGTARDAFGFPRAQHQLFGAEGQRRRLAVRPLPAAGRPPTFVNAIGEGFSIAVRASRTVVSVGEPIELEVLLRGAGALDGLGLPPLSGADALPPAHFAVPEGAPVGASDGAGGRRFAVTVRVRSAEVREVPPIAFSYFDPAVGEYRTVRSEPIALAVQDAQVVGADDVVAAPAARPAAAATLDGAAPNAGIATLLGADMAISDAAATFDAPWGARGAAPLLGALYGTPLVLAAVSFWLSRTRTRRTRSRAVRAALHAALRALDAPQPAREAAPAVLAAMRRLAAAAGADERAAAAALHALEMRAFDPDAAHEPLPEDVVDTLRRTAREWGGGAGAAPAAAAVPALLLAGVCMGVCAAAPAAAQDGADAARGIYQAALAEDDRLRRVRLFGQAERALRGLAAAHPAAAELQADWGNAALGAQDVGRAVLGWRRALRAAPGNARARANLDWLRATLPAWLPRPASSGALDSLLFWRTRLTGAQLHLIGAAAFALGVLAVLPWARRRTRAWRPIAAAAGIVWLAAAGSALLAGGEDAAVVLRDGSILRSADSIGAYPAFANALPAGTETTVLEARGGWLRVALADGSRGWLAAGAVERVAANGAD